MKEGEKIKTDIVLTEEEKEKSKKFHALKEEETKLSFAVLETRLMLLKMENELLGLLTSNHPELEDKDFTLNHATNEIFINE